MTDTDRPDVPDDVAIRTAASDERAAVLSVLDGAALETDAAALGERIARGDVLVAASDSTAAADSIATTDSAGLADGSSRSAAGRRTGTVVGALVLDGDEVANVAVRRGRRGQCIGTALVRAAAARRDRLVAEFDRDVRPFYASLGFEVEPVDDGDRCRGRFRPDRT